MGQRVQLLTAEPSTVPIALRAIGGTRCPHLIFSIKLHLSAEFRRRSGPSGLTGSQNAFRVQVRGKSVIFVSFRLKMVFISNSGYSFKNIVFVEKTKNPISKYIIVYI